MSDERKQSIYIPREMLDQMKDHAKRLNVTVSWLVRRAWEESRIVISRLEPQPPLENAVKREPKC